MIHVLGLLIQIHKTFISQPGPGGDLQVYLEGLALADDVQCYVQEHPFGRRAITTTNPSWKYYEQVVEMINRSSAKAR